MHILLNDTYFRLFLVSSWSLIHFTLFRFKILYSGWLSSINYDLYFIKNGLKLLRNQSLLQHGPFTPNWREAIPSKTQSMYVINNLEKKSSFVERH